MKLDFNEHRDIWGPLFTLHLQLWGKYVLEPALKQIYDGSLRLPRNGVLPSSFFTMNSQDLLTARGLTSELLDDADIPADHHYFDMAAEEYEMAVMPFKAPILRRVHDIIQPLIPPETRILDCACGPGHEALGLAQIAYKSEVIGIDISREMIRKAVRSAKNKEVLNVGFYQMDATDIPKEWDGTFDLVFCQLSCSYFRDMNVIAHTHARTVHSRGSVILIEPFPSINNALSMDLHSQANPLFSRYYDSETFSKFYEQAGFSDFYREEILPDIVIYIMTKTD